MIHAREDYNRIQDPAEKIPVDEPVFLIRGQDLAGPGALEAWANLAAAYGAAPNILAAARKHATLMREYQKANTGKTPDLV